MNLILFAEQELHGNILRLIDFRAEHIRKILALKPGDNLRIGMINGKIGQGTILHIDKAAVRIAVELHQEPSPAPFVELILALPRPIMLQRILKQAATLGVARIHLIRSAKVEKSFFQSPALLPEKINERLLEGLMQAAVDTRLPEVCLHPQFKVFVQDIIPHLEGCKVLAHPNINASLPEVFPKGPEQRILLAVGPEGGWNDFEITCFLAQGFTAFSLGARILHVDTAVAVLLGQLQVLQQVMA
jgi:16S rRNA (uracil1498-N3)-methyltransferase